MGNMCGIFSIINNDMSKEHIMTNFNKGVLRGPENTQTITLISPPVFLGFHRLAINGYNDELSNQPFHIDGIYLICNGEIYNWKSLYAMMNKNGKSKSDCEVIIHLYLKYGMEQTLLMLDGVFAFILLDTNENKIFVARDVYGVRPLFVKKIAKKVAFASELKQLIKLGPGPVEQFAPGTYSLIKYKKIKTWSGAYYDFAIVNKPFS